MELTKQLGEVKRVSYWQVFRMIFVFFYLFLLGDVFYRWDGFRYYGSFIEFLPNVALVSVLWSFVALFAALILWGFIVAVQWVGRRLTIKMQMEHIFLFVCFIILMGTISWFGKKIIFPFALTTFQIKSTIVISVFIIAILLTWISRTNAKKWINIIQERITPLVGLFSFFVIISALLVTYCVLFANKDDNFLPVTTQSGDFHEERPNIILVTFDSLTARDMDMYGYDRSTAPFISKWSNNSAVFTRLKAESNYTASTTSSLMTGKRVWTHQLYHSHGYKPDKSSTENLPLVLKSIGYTTMAFIANPVAAVNTLGIEHSYDIAPSPSEFSVPNSLFGIVDKFLYRAFGEVIPMYDWIIKRDFIFGKMLYALSHNFFAISETEVPPEVVFNRFLAVLDDHPAEPYFAWIHVYPPHDPYLPPAPYMGMFDSSVKLRSIHSQESVYKFKYQDYPDDIQPIVDILRARYDEFIRYCDKQFESFISELRKRKVTNNSIIIFSADHGESFEHNYLMHGYSHLYEQVTHIPLIIKQPGQSEGMIINELVEQIDIPATILDLANVSIPSWMEGRSLKPLLDGDKIRSQPVFAMNFEKNPSRGSQITTGSIAVWEGDYKLIYYLDEQQSLLFNLERDPDELDNLFDKNPEIGQRLLGLIHDNLKAANDRILSGN